MIDNDPRWMAMVEDRNRASHSYDEDSAIAIYRALPGYAEILQGLLARLEQAEGTL